jgi:hypothetical protein
VVGEYIFESNSRRETCLLIKNGIMFVAKLFMLIATAKKRIKPSRSYTLSLLVPSLK